VQEIDKPVLIYTTFPSVAEAERVGGLLVDQGLAACVNVIPGMISLYIWEGQRHRDEECVAIIKTRGRLACEVLARARREHPYTNPALLVLPVEGGSEDYIRWIEEQTRQR